MGLLIAAFDIEATSLNASYGRVLCACFKFQHERQVRTVEAFRKDDERAALVEIVSHYNEADILVGWNSRDYDVRLLNARLLRHRLAPLTPKMHIDLLNIHKYRCRTAGHKLDTVAKDLELKHQKYEVPAELWQDAADGSRPAFDKIVHHCQQDVRITEEVLDRLKGLLVHITR